MKTVLANKLRKNKKGFTLAELLVVVAIIAVLVAIAIPVFGSALSKSEHAVDVANVRAAYAEAVIDAMSDNSYDGGTLSVDADPIEAAPVNGSTVTFDTTSYKITITNGDYADSFGYDSEITFKNVGTTGG